MWGRELLAKTRWRWVGEPMTARVEVAELCQLVARLADVVEQLARDSQPESSELSRIHSVRSEVLGLERALQGRPTLPQSADLPGALH